MSERELGIIITKLDALHEDIAEIKKFHAENNNDVNDRLRSLESFRHWATGVGSFCVISMSTVASYFKWSI